MSDYKEEFKRKFGNVFDYEEEHTEWWLSKIQELKEKIRKLYKNTNLISQPNPVNDPKFIAECAYNKAIYDILSLFPNDSKQ